MQQQRDQAVLDGSSIVGAPSTTEKPTTEMKAGAASCNAEGSPPTGTNVAAASSQDCLHGC